MEGDPPSLGFRGALSEPADPVVAGLERKLDVLRAQLAACRAGHDPGEAGISEWSRLEHQSQRIAALEAELARLGAWVTTLHEDHTAARDHAARLAAEAIELTDERNTQRRARLMAEAELARARDEVIACHRTIAALGEALLATPEPAPVAGFLPGREALFQAVITSTSWRVTRPLRRLANLLKGRRDPVL